MGRFDRWMYGQQALGNIIEQLRADLAALQLAPPDVGQVDELATDWGLIEVGEARFGTGIPGGTTPFDGVRIGYPAFVYDGEEWHIVGVAADTLQFGLRASDGAALFGGGNAIMDADGLGLVLAGGQPSSITWYDSLGGTVEAYIYPLLVTDLVKLTIAANVMLDKAQAQLEFAAYEIGGDTAKFILTTPKTNLPSAEMNINGLSQIVAYKDKVVINEDGGDVDTIIEGDTDTALVHVDAANDRVGIGTATPAKKVDVNGSGIIDDLTVREAAAPATPSSGEHVFYAKTDGLPYSKDDAGVEHALSSAYSIDSYDINTADAIVTNTTTETSIYSFTISANDMGTNKIMEMQIFSEVTQNRGSANVLTVRFKLGGTTMFTQAITFGNTATTGLFEMIFEIFQITASSQRLIQEDLIQWATPIDHKMQYGTSSIDMTADRVVDVTVQWAVANANSTVSKRVAHARIINNG